MIHGRTDMRISLSGAKFGAEADFGIRLAVAGENPYFLKSVLSQRKTTFSIRNFYPKHFWVSENQSSEIVRNAFWQSFVPIRAKFDG